MADPTESEMMADLAAADAAGDTQLAQHIAGRIRAAREPGLAGRAAKTTGETLGDIARGFGSVGGALKGVAGLGGALGSYVVPYTAQPGATFLERWRNENRNLSQADIESRKRSPIGYPVGTIASALAVPIPAPATRAALAAGAAPATLAASGIYDTALMNTAMTGLQNVDQPTSEAASRMSAAATSPYNLIGAAPALYGPAQQQMSRLGDILREKAISQGRKVLTGGVTPLSARKPVSEAAVKEAYEQGAIRPLGSTEKASRVLTGAREEVGQQYADTVKMLEESGVTGPKAGDIAKQLIQEANQTAATTILSPKPQLYRRAAQEILSKPTTNKTLGGPLGLTQAEDIKRALQWEAAPEYQKLVGRYTPLGEAKIELASKMRQSVEDAIAAQETKAPEAVGSFKPVKQQLSNIIEASEAAREGVARAARRQTHGLGAKLLAAGAFGHGGPLEAVPALYAGTFLRNRWPSTSGWASWKAAEAFPAEPMSVRPDPTLAAYMANALRASPRLRMELMSAAAEGENQ